MLSQTTGYCFLSLVWSGKSEKDKVHIKKMKTGLPVIIKEQIKRLKTGLAVVTKLFLLNEKCASAWFQKKKRLKTECCFQNIMNSYFLISFVNVHSGYARKNLILVLINQSPWSFLSLFLFLLYYQSSHLNVT